MNTKLAVGVALGLLGSLSAAADVTGPIPTPFSGDGGVFVAVWSDTKSTVQYLGSTVSGFLTDDVAGAPDGMLMFDVDLGVFGGNLAGVNYAVVGADYRESLYVGNRTLFTSPGTDFVPQSGVAGSGGAIDLFVNFVNGQCGATVPCPSTSPDDEWNAISLGESLAGSLGGVNAAIGSALGFFLASGVDDFGNSEDPAKLERYGSAFGNTFVTLAQNGKLTIVTPQVPLPAAAGLLLSGLIGLGTVARRRAAAV